MTSAAYDAPPQVTWGLLASWVLHDLEEVAAAPAFARAFEERRQRPFPIPADQLRVAVALMGGVVGAASARGAATGGRSPVFQLVLLGHGLHSIWHVGATVATRGYTPGVVTAAVLVGPHGWWAWRQLRARGLLATADTRAAARVAVPATAATLVGLHLVARGLLRAVRRPGATA